MKKKTWCNYKRQILNELLVTNLLIIPLFWIIYFVAKRETWCTGEEIDVCIYAGGLEKYFLGSWNSCK